MNSGGSENTNLKIGLLTQTISHIETSLEKLEQVQSSLLATVNKLSVQVQQVIDVRNMVIEHDKTLSLLDSRMKTVEDATKSITELTTAVNKHTWTLRLSTWVVALIASVVASSVMGLAMWYVKGSSS